MAETDFISRRAIYDAVNAIGGCDATEEWAKGYDSAIDAVMGIIDGLHAADVVEVVRCKDCKYLHCHSAIDRLFFCQNIHGIRGALNPIEENPFCSYGERKER